MLMMVTGQVLTGSNVHNVTKTQTMVHTLVWTLTFEKALSLKKK